MIGSLMLFGVFFVLVAFGHKGGESFFSNLWLAGTILPAAALALASGTVGAVAAIKDTERSLSVFTAVVLGGIVAIFMIGELIFPH